MGEVNLVHGIEIPPETLKEKTERLEKKLDTVIQRNEDLDNTRRYMERAIIELVIKNEKQAHRLDREATNLRIARLDHKNTCMHRDALEIKLNEYRCKYPMELKGKK